jgi:hypothetical protein
MVRVYPAAGSGQQPVAHSAVYNAAGQLGSPSFNGANEPYNDRR